MAVLASALTGPAAHAALPPPSEGIVTGRPPPLLQGPPGPTRDLPCGIDGPAVNLGDDSRYPSGRRPLRVAMIFVDFSDAPADLGTTPQLTYDRLVPHAQRILRDLSYGKFELSVTPLMQWVRMPQPLSAYGFSEGLTHERHVRYITDALQAAAPSFDLSTFKTVYVVAGPGADLRAATTNLASFRVIEAGGARIEHGVTLAGDVDVPGITVHETGHVLGLPDLYDYNRREGWDHFVGPWDVMSNDFLTNPMLSWTRRLVGWLGDRKFRCVRRRATVELSPVAGLAGLKGAVVRAGHRRAYVVEARTDAAGAECPDQGVLIYRWGGDVENGKGPIRVIDAQPGEGKCGAHTTALFKPQERGRSRFANRRLAVTVLGGDEQGFRVRLRRKRIQPR